MGLGCYTDLRDFEKDIDDTKGYNAILAFLEKLYINHLVAVVDVDGYDA